MAQHSCSRAAALLALTAAAQLLVGCAQMALPAGPPAAADVGVVAAAEAASAARLGVSGARREYPLSFVDLIVSAVDDGRVAAPATLAKSTSTPGSIEQARKLFYDSCPSNARCGELRDRVQDRLIWASNAACNDYIRDVRHMFTATNLNLGAFTTILGGLGSVLSSADATRVFSGAAAVTSGMRAEYNDVNFSSQAFELISRSIRAVRERSVKRIREYRENRDIRLYNLDAAIGDAINYHGQCNIAAGLEEASDAVTRDRDPGLRRTSELLREFSVGASLSLGSAVIETSNLPSAQASCLRWNTVLAAADTRNAEMNQLETQVPAEKQTDFAQLKSQLRAKIDAVKQARAGSASCSGSPTPAALREQELYQSIQDFNAAPVESKQVKRAEFDAAKARVLAVKSEIDSQLNQADRMLAEAADLVARAKPVQSPAPVPGQ